MAVPRFILDRRDDIAALCRRHHARRLELFGSASRSDFDPARSDLDFLVSFDELPPVDYYDAFFSLKEGLEAMFDRPVDLVVERAVRNPYLKQRVDAERQSVYASSNPVLRGGCGPVRMPGGRRGAEWAGRHFRPVGDACPGRADAGRAEKIRP